MMTNIMVKACLNQEIMKISNLIQEKIKNNACPRPKFNRRPNLSESRISPNVSKFRSVDWTHDMIIVKWHLLIWHKRKFCALTNRPPAQSTRTGQWLSKLLHSNCSAAQVYVLHPWQFIFVPSCRRRSVLQVFLSSKRWERFLKNFSCIWWWQKLWWKLCPASLAIHLRSLVSNETFEFDSTTISFAGIS